MKPFTHVSPSQITTYHEDVGGCNRKWWLNKIAGYPIPQHPSAALGEATHKSIEEYLAGEPGGVNAIALPSLALLRELREAKPLVEAKMQRTLRNGLTFVGRIDILALSGFRGPEPTVVDHKTSSSEQWALTEEQLYSDIQMNAYAYEALCRKPAPAVRVAHNFLRTKGAPYHRYTATVIPAPVVHKNWTKIQDITDKMIETAKLPDPAQVPGNPRVCDKYNGCAFRDKCSAIDRSTSKNPYEGIQEIKTAMPTQTKASALAAMGLTDDIIAAAVAKGTAIEDRPGKGAPAIQQVNPPEAPVDGRTAKAQAQALAAAAPAKPAEPEAPAPTAEQKMVYAVKSLGWPAAMMEEEISDAALDQICTENIPYENVESMVKGKGTIDGQTADGVVLSIVVKKPAPAPVVEPAAPARPRRGVTPGQVVVQKEAEPAPAVQSAPVVRQPRNAHARLAALGWPTSEIEGMSTARMKEILDAEQAYVYPEQEEAQTPAERAAEASVSVTEQSIRAVEAQRTDGQQGQATVEECEKNDGVVAGYVALVEELEGKIKQLEAALGVARSENVEASKCIAELEGVARLGPTGTTLYIDCAPEDGSGVELDAFLQPLMRKVEQDGYTDEKTGKRVAPVAYYDLIPYNNGAKAVAGYLLSSVAHLPPVLLVDSASPMAARALEILRPLAAQVVVRRGR